MSQSSNKKSQFPPRKRSPSSSSTINCKESIINYQKDIQLLKARIQELENHLDKLSEPDSELIQLYQLAQIEWNKLTEENTKLKKIVTKDQTQNPLSQNKDVDPSLLHLENQKLKEELEKKNSIIREMANQPFFSSSLNNDEDQLKKLTIENMRLRNELQNANLALALNNNVMPLDTFNKILLEKQKTKTEPNEEIRLLQDENKSLRIQINELESEIYEISNNNPELQASLEAEKQLRKLNKELEEKIHKLEIQLKSGTKPNNNSNPESNDQNAVKKTTKKSSQFDDFDDILNDDELFEKEIDAMDDGFVTLKNTSDEDDEDDFDNQQSTRKNKNKEFELGGEMAMFSAILAPLKKRLDERCRQIEIEKMKEEGAFTPIKEATNEEGEKDDENELGVDLIDDSKNDTDKSNDNDN